MGQQIWQQHLQQVAYECTPCDLRTCPEEPPHTCPGGRNLALDPCGCCDHCSRLQWESCGGTDWTFGYCGLGLTCVAVNGTTSVDLPIVGICKELPDRPEAGLEDERCPLQTGCNTMGGQCSCDSQRTCINTFTYPNMEACLQATGTVPDPTAQPYGEESHHEGTPPPVCVFSGCNLTADGCVCDTHGCQGRFSYANLSQCQAAAEELRCAGVTCSTPEPPDCPADSVLSKSYTPPTGCCPTALPVCTCDFGACLKPECPSGQQLALLREAAGEPGDCCSVYECQRGSPKCIHKGKEFSDGEGYRMDPCWLCQCRGGISFCSKAECAKLQCDNFYIPEGECCPVCIDVELLSAESREASCWVNGRLRLHEEQWKEDDCTFCQCVDGERHCTAMACKQSCRRPLRIPGECCPFCEEPSFETVSPLLCPPLENCSLTTSDCPRGFLQDNNGCLLCHCVNIPICPDLITSCSLHCPFGYKKDDSGCKVCECTPQPIKCRLLTCSKSCPYGYVRNKHGCEMCRCVKCPPFTCDKSCSDGYQQSKKGCSLCMCKETRRVPSTTTPAPAPHYCFTASGQRYKDGESWYDGCRDCYCHGGREMCVLITCPVPSCPQPVVRPDLCCPTCEDESGSGQPEGTDLVVCQAPGGDFYVEGETWKLDGCTHCTCRRGRVLCETEVCPPALCQAPARNKDTCCYVCPEDQLKPLLPVNGSQSGYCISSEGDILLAGDSWKVNPCTSCTCNNGTIQCFSHRCPPANCRVPVLLKGQCCPHCLDMRTTSAPLLVSTMVPEQNTIVLSEGGTSQPPLVVIVTTGSSLGEDFPNQTEVALIYQSMAWILAGLLLAVVIFLIVALLVNKKKKWVQMPCYSTPKKTVILKKHVNKSPAYMEPSKENKFQAMKISDYGMNFSPEAGSPCGDRLSIPRAKLFYGHGELLR
ncbi:cysteine-rich motor neuron 1 protein-like isoform X2 [Paramormyrops kingsleyae]|uniref:Cysteine-rich motor neuron 1 protein-like n=1 Tax=Paramormyrops kingsleyae TaxID=1676925 RepID=A0A3B3RGK7_9TELE|nr:cysteine-rich motor neuron 1 protein-like isoform X2 [Paramormyrops kingsleyae]